MDFQFYPTPAKTAALMWSQFKRPIGMVCDPSAGRGHLIQHAQDGFEGVPENDLPWLDKVEDETYGQGGYRLRLRERMRFKFKQERHLKFLAVEIDPQHHANLRDMGGEILGYDFLQIESLATVNQIIMNPPFADGAKHVLHAWKVVHDAEIVAIVNAETIRNPHSQDRKALLELIGKHGRVSFHENHFIGDDVVRETGVEIALIYLEKVPQTMFDMDGILAGLKQGDNIKGPEVEPEVANALALPENLIENTYQRFRIAVQAARQAAEAVALSGKASNDLGITLSQMQSKGVGNDFRNEPVDVRKIANDHFRQAYDELKQVAWAQIIRSSLLTDKLSNQARRKVESEAQLIYKMEFSVANVHGFLAGLYESMGDIYADMICGLFDNIVGRSNDNVAFYKTWKSNERHRFGMRLRRTRFIIPNFRVTWGGSLLYESEQFLSDIDKVFGYLHGVTEKYDGLVNAFKRSESHTGERISTRYFDFRFYKGAGTMHFYPKSQEVVEKLNRFVGARRQWLPDTMEKANADFNKQYEDAENLTKQYTSAFAKTGQGRWYNSPVFAATTENQTEERQQTCQTLANCIDQVHEALGLHCGPALTYAQDPAKAIAYDHDQSQGVQSTEATNEVEQRQLSLID